MSEKRLQDHLKMIDMETIFQSISDFISIHDEQFRIIRANKALCDVLNVSEKELIGSHCYEVFHSHSSPLTGCPHLRSIHEKIPVSELVEDTSLRIPLLVTCSPIFDENGEILGSVHVARDMSAGQFSAAKDAEVLKKLRQTLQQLESDSGIVTLCASCKNIRNDQGEWINLERFISKLCNVLLSHGICPDCAEELYPDISDM